MSEHVVKLRCQACAGKIALADDYYRELIGHTVACPHCQAKVTVPAKVEQSKQNLQGVHSVGNTRPIETPARNPRASGAAESRKCPFCKDEIGPRDQVCIRCGNKLPPG